MTFRVGMKVVCVAGRVPGNFSWPGKFMPVVGSIYTIRDIHTDVFRPEFGVGLLLEEIVNPNSFDGEPGFYSSRFRPVVERKTDIAIFTKMLTPSEVSA